MNAIFDDFNFSLHTYFVQVVAEVVAAVEAVVVVVAVQSCRLNINQKNWHLH